MEVDLGQSTRPRLAVVGVYTASEAYPNTLYSLLGLRKLFVVEEINAPFLPLEGGALRDHASVLIKMFRLAWTHARVITKVVLRVHGWQRAYVPYPAPVILWIWSLLPTGLRPKRIVADAFISLYDTVVNDRHLLQPNDWRAKVLWRIERRGYSFADRIIVDTPQNASFYASLFELPIDHFLPIPLATNEHEFSYSPLHELRDIFKVLFIGTLTPLHGIDVIVSAARILQHKQHIRFTVIGTGQEEAVVQAALDDGLSNVEWIREWRTPEQLASSIVDADVCLGIFGTGSKTQRVCPYKIYAYATVGRPVVTAATEWLKEAANGFGSMPFLPVPAGDARALAEGIARLADDGCQRNGLAQRARTFYEGVLANRWGLDQLVAALMGSEATGTTFEECERA